MGIKQMAKNAVAKKDGPAVIDNMVGKFQGIVDGLDKGITLCEDTREQNTAIIEDLTKKNTFLGDKRQQALTFRDNLKRMMSGPFPEPPADTPASETTEDNEEKEPKE